MILIPGISSQLLCSRIARELGAKLGLVEYRRFPDGELYSRVLDPIDRGAVIVQSIVDHLDLACLIQLLDICEPKLKAVVIPYLGYSRQDRQFNPGEPISVRGIAKLVSGFKTILVNLHSSKALSYFSDCLHLNAAPELSRYLAQEFQLKSPVFLAPDQGAAQLARSAAGNWDWDVLVKRRISDFEVELSPSKIGDLKGRDLVLVDDIISTGGTMAQAISQLSSRSPSRIFCCCIHPVLALNALTKLYSAGATEVIATDTIETGISYVSVAKLIADALRSLS